MEGLHWGGVQIWVCAHKRAQTHPAPQMCLSSFSSRLDSQRKKIILHLRECFLLPAPFLLNLTCRHMTHPHTHINKTLLHTQRRMMIYQTRPDSHCKHAAPRSLRSCCRANFTPEDTFPSLLCFTTWESEELLFCSCLVGSDKTGSKAKELQHWSQTQFKAQRLQEYSFSLKFHVEASSRSPLMLWNQITSNIPNEVPHGSGLGLISSSGFTNDSFGVWTRSSFLGSWLPEKMQLPCCRRTLVDGTLEWGSTLTNICSAHLNNIQK